MTDDLVARDYLTGWADAAKHPITIESGKDLGGDWQYVAVCACGWRDQPVSWRSQAARDCPVLDVLLERRQRMQLRG